MFQLCIAPYYWSNKNYSYQWIYLHLGAMRKILVYVKIVINKRKMLIILNSLAVSFFKILLVTLFLIYCEIMYYLTSKRVQILYLLRRYYFKAILFYEAILIYHVMMNENNKANNNDHNHMNCVDNHLPFLIDCKLLLNT